MRAKRIKNKKSFFILSPFLFAPHYNWRRFFSKAVKRDDSKEKMLASSCSINPFFGMEEWARYCITKAFISIHVFYDLRVSGSLLVKRAMWNSSLTESTISSPTPVVQTGMNS
jgi:hypothetical protein